MIESGHLDSDVVEPNPKLAAELRKLSAMAEGGKLPVFVCVYQTEKKPGEDRGYGSIAQAQGKVGQIYAAVGQMFHAATLVGLNMPEPSGETFNPFDEVKKEIT